MRRIVLAALLAVLALPPAAAAKGPHASVSPGPTGIEPGEPWIATLRLLEYERRAIVSAQPTVSLRSGDTRLTVRPSRFGAYVPIGDVLVEARYRLRVVFPHAGRWSYTLLDGTADDLRFRFPPALVGRDSRRVIRDVVAFPVGSPEAAAPSGGGPLPPEVVSLPADETDALEVAGLWVLAALPLVWAGTLALRERRRGTA